MLLARSTDAVAQLVSRLAVELLGFPVNPVHYYDEERDSLIPVAQSAACHDVLGDPPKLGSGLAWERYQSGTVTVYPGVPGDRKEAIFGRGERGMSSGDRHRAVSRPDARQSVRRLRVGRGQRWGPRRRPVGGRRD